MHKNINYYLATVSIRKNRVFDIATKISSFHNPKEISKAEYDYLMRQGFKVDGITTFFTPDFNNKHVKHSKILKQKTRVYMNTKKNDPMIITARSPPFNIPESTLSKIEKLINIYNNYELTYKGNQSQFEF